MNITMNRALMEVASTCSRESSRNSSKDCTKSLFKDKNLLIIAVVIILIACSCGGNGFGGGFGIGNSCNTGKRCGQKGNSWIWIIAVLLLFSGGLGSNGLISPGNINTNIIKVDSAEDFEDDYSDCCC